jgi:hypothetical protein
MKLKDIKVGEYYACGIGRKSIERAIGTDSDRVNSIFRMADGWPHAPRCKVLRVGVPNGPKLGVLVELGYRRIRTLERVEDNYDGTFTHWRGLVYEGDPRRFEGPAPWLVGNDDEDDEDDDYPEVATTHHEIELVLPPTSLWEQWDEYLIQEESNLNVRRLEMELRMSAKGGGPRKRGHKT